MKVQHFFDKRTSTLTYVVYDEASKTGVVIDPVLDFEQPAGRTFEESLTTLCQFLDEQKLSVPYVLDTHVHADHMTGFAKLKDKYGSKTVIGSHIATVQKTFAELFHIESDVAVDGSQFDRLLADGEVLDAGPFSIRAHYTPGHTPACSTYQIDDKLFVGDVIFMPDFGTARCDFPGGSAELLYDSIQRLYQLPDATEIYVCHDYQPGGRELRFQTTVGDQKRSNVQLQADTAKADFVKFRSERDAKLSLPTLMLAVLQVNMRAGALPEPESNGTSYLKLPLNQF
ncbi:MAG: MBL fold metallo-hydrolase [Deltaproteobacteria bacterium]|nr:MBL fold metallo-hydrolase [Deltaproteobacteria bacterium]MBW2531309.1 MBL fold metallo-hydrolase [Deltaproteobacteria bacterium]